MCPGLIIRRQFPSTLRSHMYCQIKVNINNLVFFPAIHLAMFGLLCISIAEQLGN